MTISGHEKAEKERGIRMRELLGPYKPKGCRSVMDLGCGDGLKCREYHKDLFVVGVEADKHKAELAAQVLDVVLWGDMYDTIGMLALRGVSWITMLDSLEHLSMEDASIVLSEIVDDQRAEACTIFAPIGDTSGWRTGKQGLDDHLSVWEPEDLDRWGFRVKVLGSYHGRGKDAMIAHWSQT